jgi:hypothetical protein
MGWLSYVIVYGQRCGRDSSALAASSFLKRSRNGSQKSFRFDFIAM